MPLFVKKSLPALGIVLLVIIFTLFIHNRLLGLAADVDGFYHIKHAWLYLHDGLFQTAFPWVQYSVINQYAADLWYGFHILLIPFTLLGNFSTGIEWGAIFITAVSSLLFFAALKKLGVRWPILWLAIFWLASADFLYRLTMLRPHPLSASLSILLFAYLQDKKWAPIFLISAVISWLHLALSWLPILVVLAVVLFETLEKRGIDFKKLAAMFGGLLVGWLLRPNPFGAAKLAYIQVVKFFFEQQGELPIRFGRELTPFGFENFIDQLIPITLLVLVSVILIIWYAFSKKNFRGLPWASLVLVFIFFVLTFWVARRSNDIFIGFAVVFLSLTFTWLQKGWQDKMAVLLFLAIAYMPFHAIYRFDSYVAHSFDFTRFQELSDWLKKNSQPGEIVFNMHWDRFPQLFFYNHHNYYINGMDPIFQYELQPELYWKTHFFAVNLAGPYTCKMLRCTQEEAEDVHTVLKNDFRSSYIVVEPARSPRIYEYLSSDSRFKKVFENNRDSLFQIL